MSGFTLRVMVGGETRLTEPMAFDRFLKLAPSLEPMIKDLVPAGRVVFLADTEDGVSHILGRWR